MKFVQFASQVKPQAERPLLYPPRSDETRSLAPARRKARRDIVNYDLPGVLLRNPEW